MPREAEEYFGPGDVSAHFPRRGKDSHKGQNGKLLIIGGSQDFHGAPLINFFGAESVGVDLVTIFVPKIHAEVSKQISPNIFVKTFRREYFSKDDLKEILEISQKYTACVLGSGIGKNKETKEAVIDLLDQLKIPCVIDADAIFKFSDYKKIPKSSVFTPHQKEFERLGSFKIGDGRLGMGDDLVLLRNFLNLEYGENFDLTILKKGVEDLICGALESRKNKTGTAILSKGGTGDFLAGMVGALLSRGVGGFYSAGIASFLLGFSADTYLEKHGESICFEKFSRVVAGDLRGFARY